MQIHKSFHKVFLSSVLEAAHLIQRWLLVMRSVWLLSQDFLDLNNIVRHRYDNKTAKNNKAD